MLMPHLLVAVNGGRFEVARFDEGQINLIPKLNHPHRTAVLHTDVYLRAQELIAKLFDVGFLLLIVAEPVRFLFAGAIPGCDIIADMPPTKTPNEMTLLVSAHGGRSVSNILANVGWGGIDNFRNILKPNAGEVAEWPNAAVC